MFASSQQIEQTCSFTKLHLIYSKNSSDMFEVIYLSIHEKQISSFSELFSIRFLSLCQSWHKRQNGVVDGEDIGIIGQYLIL
jgi:hypothetical protein